MSEPNSLFAKIHIAKDNFDNFQKSKPKTLNWTIIGWNGGIQKKCITRQIYKKKIFTVMTNLPTIPLLMVGKKQNTV